MYQTNITRMSTFRFGKYIGRKASSVAEFDPCYIFYLASKDDFTISDGLILAANRAKADSL